MLNELLTKARDEVKQTLMLIVYSFKELVPEDRGWTGEYTASISHCLIPGEETDCGDLITITEVRPEKDRLTGRCQDCNAVFTVRTADLIYEG